MNRENSAGSEMSKLLSFGYLGYDAQSSVENRKLSAGSRHQAVSAGDLQPAAGYSLSSQISTNLPSAPSSAA